MLLVTKINLYIKTDIKKPIYIYKCGTSVKWAPWTGKTNFSFLDVRMRQGSMKRCSHCSPCSMNFKKKRTDRTTQLVLFAAGIHAPVGTCWCAHLKSLASSRTKLCVEPWFAVFTQGGIYGSNGFKNFQNSTFCWNKICMRSSCIYL